MGNHPLYGVFLSGLETRCAGSAMRPGGTDTQDAEDRVAQDRARPRAPAPPRTRAVVPWPAWALPSCCRPTWFRVPNAEGPAHATGPSPGMTWFWRGRVQQDRGSMGGPLLKNKFPTVASAAGD